MERNDTLEPPFAQRHVQLTVAVIVSAALLWLLISSAGTTFPTGQHNLLFGDGEAADRGHGALIQIDVNVANVRELALLPGVGPILAHRIVDNRARLGPFQSVDDLGRVYGIGPKTLAEIRRFCVVGPEFNVEPSDRRLAATVELGE